ncbi:MAG: glutamate 5-kinase [Methylacidiphilales bacterium]|nr:glutamate 5-kinase [Candidatus Methylacidiphilales bacterium]
MIEQIRNHFAIAKRIVIKVGSNLVSAQGTGIDSELIEQWTSDIASLRAAGKDIVLVSSGAVSVGMARMKLSKRPTKVLELQALAAIGQSGLMNIYDHVFAKVGLTCAQILLTHADLDDRARYLNARSTFETLLAMQVIPIVNENDTVTIDEIRFGDNDTLSALICNLIGAEVLILLSDQEGLYKENPKLNPNAELIQHAPVNDTLLLSYAGKEGALGRGGMKSKVLAARLASRSATQTVIAHGKRREIIKQIISGAPIGTVLYNSELADTARKHWIRAQLKANGTVILDGGAVSAITELKKSLLPVGVVNCTGNFQRGEVVLCVNIDGAVIARGISNYSIEETIKILQKPSNQIASILGYEGDSELIHRDNLVLE